MADPRSMAKQVEGNDISAQSEIGKMGEQELEDPILQDAGKILWQQYGSPPVQVNEVAGLGENDPPAIKVAGFEQLDGRSRAEREEEARLLMNFGLDRPVPISQPKPRTIMQIPWLQDPNPNILASEGSRNHYEDLEVHRLASFQNHQGKKETAQRREARSYKLVQKNESLRMDFELPRRELLYFQGKIVKHSRCDSPIVRDYLNSRRLGVSEGYHFDIGAADFDGDSIPLIQTPRDNPGSEPGITSDGTVVHHASETDSVGAGETASSPSVDTSVIMVALMQGTVGRGYVEPINPGQTLPNNADIDARFDIHGDNGQVYVASTIFQHGHPRLSSLQIGQRVSFKPMLAHSIHWAVDVLLFGDEHYWRPG